MILCTIRKLRFFGDLRGEKHLYIHVCKQPGILGVATRKQEASSFKAVRTYFKQVLVNKDMG